MERQGSQSQTALEIELMLGYESLLVQKVMLRASNERGVFDSK